MSMGDGDLHLKCEALEIKLEQAQADRDAYKRQLGGTTAAMNRVKDANGRLCAEINRQEKRIEALEGLVRDVWAAYAKEADASFHPEWEADGELRERMKSMGLEVC